MESEKKVFTPAQVSLHNTINDCWLTINARVYDVTNFLSDHPGGDEILLASAGEDASEDFEKAGHGSAARLMLDEFYVGEMAHSNSTSIQKTIESETHLNQQTPRNKEANYSSVIFLVPLAILGFVISISFYKN